MNGSLAEGYEACRKIMKESGKSYYFATSLFGDLAMKRSTWALYAFFRVPDDIVDEQPHISPGERQQQLEAYRLKWQEAMRAGTSDDAQMSAIVDTFSRWNIPAQYGEVFLDSMAMDVSTTRYQTYADLEKYMYGSAGVVGKMVAHIIGYKDPEALEYAKTLGYAMQLTNFLRDIEADYRQLGRVYMPEDELAQFGLSVEDIAKKNWSPAFREFMQFEVDRTWQMYEEGNKCLPLFDSKGRFTYKMASVLYSRILTKLEQQDYNPFAGRVSTSFAEKLWLLCRTYLLSR